MAKVNQPDLSGIMYLITWKGVSVMVYVISKNGQPLMPTGRCGKVKHLLRSGRAVVIKRCPFTIQLTYDSKEYTQELTLGIDAGSKKIGVSVTTEKKEYYSSEVELRNDIVKNLSTRREMRRARRNRKTRYRAKRFNNRKASKQPVWIAPSVQNKIDSHLKTVENIRGLVPIKKIIVETASFDIQKIKNDRISGTEYQEGDMLGFWNVREYVLFRDGHVCQCCRGKSKDKILNVHHIESRKTGGDRPDNLITLCEYCHKQYHLRKLKLPADIKKKAGYRDAAFMGIMRWAFYNKLKDIYPGLDISLTYGYITKNTRIEAGLPKEHNVDARCITSHQDAIPCDEVFYVKKVRCHNRQIHKMTISKGGYRKRNQTDYEVKGFRLYDKVAYNGQECFIFGRRSSGSFDIRLVDGTKINAGAGYKKLTLLETRKSYLVERRRAVPPTTEVVGFPA